MVSLSFKAPEMNRWIIAVSFGEENVLTGKVVKVSHRIQKMRYIYPFVMLVASPSGTVRLTRSLMESIARGRRWAGLHWPHGSPVPLWLSFPGHAGAGNQSGCTHSVSVAAVEALGVFT